MYWTVPYMSIPTHCVRLSIMNINVPPRTILCPTYLLSSPCNKLGGSTSSLLSSAPSIELHPTPVTCSDGLFYGSNQLVEIININRSLLWLKRGYSWWSQRWDWCWYDKLFLTISNAWPYGLIIRPEVLRYFLPPAGCCCSNLATWSKSVRII